MKKALGLLILLSVFALAACEQGQEREDRKTVDRQQEHYANVQPLPAFDYSVPRDVLTQIYTAVTQGNRQTYTVVESMTGDNFWSCPSIGYA